MKESRVNDMDLDKRIDSILKKNKVKNSLVDFIDNSKLKLYPLKYVSIMTTSVCTSNCVYCPYPYAWTTLNPGYMKDELYERIVLDIKNTYPDFDGHYSYQNGNEPTADPKFLQRIEFFYKMLPNTRMNFPTNANLLDPERGRKLIDLMMKYENWGDGKNRYGLFIHFAGTDKESWQEIMGSKYEYEQTIDNIRSIMSYNTQQGGVIPIIFMGYHGNDPGLTNKNPTDADLSVKFYDPQDWYNHIEKLFGTYGQYQSSSTLFQNRSGDLRLFDEWRGNRPVREIGPNNEFNCARFFDGKGLHVLYDGSVTVCCNDWQKRNILGNLNTQTITELFNGREYKEFMYMGKGYIESPPDFICKMCTDIQAINDIE